MVVHTFDCEPLGINSSCAHRCVCTSYLHQYFVCTLNLPTNIVDFRGFDSNIMSILNGGIPMSIGEKFESNNVSTDNVSREIGRTYGYVLMQIMYKVSCVCDRIWFIWHSFFPT